MIRPHYYDRSGQPVADVIEWARMFEAADRRVGDDTVVCGDESVRVSTVFLGLDRSFGYGPPLIFETMVFGGPPQIDQWQRRYTTEVGARRGHAATVAALQRADLRWFEEE